MTSPHQITAGILTRAHQITRSLLLRPRHPHRRDLTQPQQPRQPLGITPIGLDPVGRSPDPRRRRNNTVDPGLRTHARASRYPVGPASYTTRTGTGKVCNHATVASAPGGTHSDRTPPLP